MSESGVSTEKMIEERSQPPPRPASVTFLILGVLIITCINLLRLMLSLRYWKFLALQPGVPFLYITLTGLIWSLAGAYLIWGLWKARQWAPRLMQAVSLTYALYYWLDHLFLADHPLSGAQGAVRALLPANWQFAAVVTILCLAFTAWTLGREKVRAYFGLASSGLEPNPAEEEDVERKLIE